MSSQKCREPEEQPKRIYLMLEASGLKKAKKSPKCNNITNTPLNGFSEKQERVGLMEFDILHSDSFKTHINNLRSNAENLLKKLAPRENSSCPTQKFLHHNENKENRHIRKECMLKIPPSSFHTLKHTKVRSEILKEQLIHWR